MTLLLNVSVFAEVIPSNDDNLFQDLTNSYLQQLKNPNLRSANMVKEQTLDDELVAISKSYKINQLEVATICSVINKKGLLRATTTDEVSQTLEDQARCKITTTWKTRTGTDFDEIALYKITGSTSGYNSGFSGDHSEVDWVQMDWSGRQQVYGTDTFGMSYNKTFSPKYMEAAEGAYTMIGHHATFYFKRGVSAPIYELYLEANYEP